MNNYADIGGCFGFGANSMAFHIKKKQGKYPELKVFEISSKFATLGKQLFPYMDFVLKDFSEWNGTPKIFDLVTLFDVVEHLVNPEEFLSKLALRMRLGLIKTPMETRGEWRGGKPLFDRKAGDHPDGHVNFFTPGSFINLLKKSKLEIVGKWRLTYSFMPIGALRILEPEYIHTRSFSGISKATIRNIACKILPKILLKKIFGGGDFLCLVRSMETKGS